jgi:hypothetical protein
MSSGTIIENERGFLYLELTDPKSFDWGTLKPLNGKTAEAITVVIPGYSAIFETLHCIYSRICAKSRLDIRLIAIDDCSPEPDIFEQLSVLANEYGLFQLWRNDERRRFPRGSRTWVTPCSWFRPLSKIQPIIMAKPVIFSAGRINAGLSAFAKKVLAQPCQIRGAPMRFRS